MIRHAAYVVIFIDSGDTPFSYVTQQRRERGDATRCHAAITAADGRHAALRVTSCLPFASLLIERQRSRCRLPIAASACFSYLHTLRFDVDTMILEDDDLSATAREIY